MPTLKSLSERLIFARDRLHLNPAAVARLIPMSSQGYLDIESGKSKLPRNIEKIAEVLKVSPNWLLFGEGEINSIFPWIPPDTIPLLDSHEFTSLIISHTEPEKSKFIKPPFDVENRNLIAWKVEDDSMFSPTARPKPYVPGEIIIIDREATHFSGDLVVVIRRGRVLFRKLIHDEIKQVLIAENPIYPKIDYISMDEENEENCIFCGTVISSVFENKR